MNIKLNFALFSILFLILAGLIFFNFSQQKKINRLTEKLNIIIDEGSSEDQIIATSPERVAEINEKILQAEKMQLMNNINSIIGDVVSVDGNRIIVKAQTSVSDLENSSIPDPKKGIELKDVEYVVNINESTKFENGTLATLKKDSFVIIVPTESVYGKTEFTAASIREGVQPIRPTEKR